MLTYSHLLRSLISPSVLVVAVLTFVGCGNKQEVSVSQASLSAVKPVDVTIENDKQFLVQAVQMEYEQTMISKLAQTRSSSEELKALAKIIEESSRSEKSTLASLGIMKSIPVPSVPTQNAHDAYNELNESPVEEFDYAYIQRAIQGYNDLITHFENASRMKIDPDIQAKAVAMLPDIRLHLMKAKEFDTQINPVASLVIE